MRFTLSVCMSARAAVGVTGILLADLMVRLTTDASGLVENDFLENRLCPALLAKLALMLFIVLSLRYSNFVGATLLLPGFLKFDANQVSGSPASR